MISEQLNCAYIRNHWKGFTNPTCGRVSSVGDQKTQMPVNNNWNYMALVSCGDPRHELEVPIYPTFYTLNALSNSKANSRLTF